MLEPVCGPCVGMGQAPPSNANSLRTFNRNFRGRSGTASDCVYLCSPAVAAVSMLTGKIEDPREYGDAPEVLPAPELKPYVDDVHIERYAKPGGILVGADSHTTTSGALGMIAIGSGGLDVAVAAIRGSTIWPPLSASTAPGSARSA